jgi:hypothetical protein
MNKKEKEMLKKQAENLKGKRQTRYISDKEIEKMAELDRKRNLKGKTIRVYSFDGFVANSYKYPSYIDYIERTCENEKKKFRVNQTGASRSYGTGSLITVNGRAF